MDNSLVDSIRVNDDSVEVSTAIGDFSAARLIVTAGSWAKSLLSDTGLHLPVRVLRCQLNFLQPDDLPLHSHERCPVYIVHVRSREPESIYGIPAHGGSGFKVAWPWRVGSGASP